MSNKAVDNEKPKRRASTQRSGIRLYRNRVALWRQPGKHFYPFTQARPCFPQCRHACSTGAVPRNSVLAWPAWLRMLAVAPAVAALAPVAWARPEIHSQHPALHHVSGQFMPGSLAAVVEPNGSGKSTLLKSIMVLLPIAGGKVAVNTAQRRIAYLPQPAERDRSFPMTVHDCVLLGCWPRRLGQAGRAERGHIDNALQSVGPQGFEQRAISTLSRGSVAAGAVCPHAGAGCRPDPAGRALQRHRQQNHRHPARHHRRVAPPMRTVIAVLHDKLQVRSHFPQTPLLARELITCDPRHWR
ncbi:MAG: transporter related protein [Polaromonas sp.]|nr:transporter related protein [Polaromonas sp.]